ncbi:MAG: hypothetical protein ABI411_00210 [Tahibacter sp.]
MATTKRTTSGTGTRTRSSSREITPRKAGLTSKAVSTIAKARSPRIYVPLLIAAGIGAAVLQRVLSASQRHSSGKMLGAVAAELQPRMSEAMRALSAFGHDLRARIAR